MKLTKCNMCKKNDVEDGVSYTCSGSPNNHGIIDFVCNCCDECANACQFDQTA